jgi:hypothetical protein
MMIGSRWVEAFAHETLTYKMNNLSQKKKALFPMSFHTTFHTKKKKT